MSGVKTPPRYVPTLTEVVTEPEGEALPPGLPEELDDAAPAGDTLSELDLRPDSEMDLDLDLDLGLEPAPFYQAPTTEASPLAAAMRKTRDDDSAAWAEEQLVQRLLERVENGLDQRLRETIAQVVQEQTRSVTLRLQEALESVVRQAVQDALAQERELGAGGTDR